MKKYVIKGLKRKQTLEGVYTVSGSKNSGLPALAMSLLFKKEVTLKNIPEIEDIFKLSEILEKIGIKVLIKKNTFKIDSGKISSSKIDRFLGGELRASLILTGPILARTGSVEFYFPGGCSIGKRPIDVTLLAFEKLGAVISGRGDKIIIKSKEKTLIGAEIIMPVQSVTATENIMMTAVLAKGKTIIKNAAMEPEIEYLAKYLNLVGAKITGAGTPVIEIIGRNGKLLENNVPEYVNMADRIEAGSIAILAAVAGKDITIRHFVKDHLENFLQTFDQIGVKYEFIQKNVLRIKKQNIKSFKGVNIKTHEHPGFPTDLQSQMGVLLTQAKGESRIFETIFESRLDYLSSLSRMGASIKK
jgi:UDP-N-acetylglucosamine 1-carboxyvinyltransferase